MDLGAHPVYIMAGLLGAPKRVTAMLTNLYGTSSDENAIALAEFEGGVLATMETAFVTEGVPDLLEVYGTGGAVFMRGGELMQNIGNGPEEVDDLPARLDPMEQFISACLAGEKEAPGLGLHDALVMTRIMEAAYKADATGNTVVF
jgi:predicted dehydrogenase